MKILFLSTEGTKGGAAVVTGRLVEALRNMGEDARMLVGRSCSSDPWMAQVGQVRRRIAKVAERGEIFFYNGFNRSDLWKVSAGRFGCGALSHPWVKDADVVVLGWINQGFLSLGDIRELCSMGKKVVWWMHDLWCATGMCHLPGECSRFELGCGDCPMLHWGKCKFDLSHRVWERKMGIFKLGNIKFLAVSRWQRDVALRSSLLREEAIGVLPHAFPVEQYPTTSGGGLLPDELRFLGRLKDKKLIVMGAARLDDPVKDLPMAIESLNRLLKEHPAQGKECVAVLFGGLSDPGALSGLKLPWHYAGMLGGEALRQLYARAAVVLSTSRYETMGATLMEGMAAGAVPVAFGRGGQTDIITHGENGYIADYGDPSSVASCIAKALLDPFSRDAQHASVKARFSSAAVARCFLDIFA